MLLKRLIYYSVPIALVATSITCMELPKRPAYENASNADQALKRHKTELTDAQKETLLAQVRSTFYANFSKPMKVLFESVAVGDAEGAREALKKLQNVAAIKTNREGMNPLHMAALRGHATIVNELLDFGLDSNITSGRTSHHAILYGPTPLFFAVNVGHLEIVRILLTRGARLDKTDGTGLTPLHHAAKSYHGSVDIITDLLDHGANIEAHTIHGETPLHLAIHPPGSISVIRTLLKRGAQANPTSIGGLATPLYHAGTSHRFDVVKELLRWGAKYEQGDFRFIIAAFGNHHFLLPVFLGNRDMLMQTIEAGIDQAALNEALVFAVAQRQPELVTLLLSNGAQPEEALLVLNIIMHHDTFSPAEQAIYRTLHTELIQRMTLREIILRRRSLRDRLISSIHMLPEELRKVLLAQKNT